MHFLPSQEVDMNVASVEIARLYRATIVRRNLRELLSLFLLTVTRGIVLLSPSPPSSFGFYVIG
jgi:hypothetical protein